MRVFWLLIDYAGLLSACLISEKPFLFLGWLSGHPVLLPSYELLFFYSGSTRINRSTQRRVSWSNRSILSLRWRAEWLHTLFGQHVRTRTSVTPFRLLTDYFIWKNQKWSILFSVWSYAPPAGACVVRQLRTVLPYKCCLDMPEFRQEVPCPEIVFCSADTLTGVCSVWSPEIMIMIPE